MRRHLVATILLVACLAFPSTARAAGSSALLDGTQQEFGLLVPADLRTSLGVGRALGVDHQRVTINVRSWNGSCAVCDWSKRYGFGVILTLRNAADREPSTVPTDLTAYSRRVQEILTKVRPALVVIENEMDSTDYYTGDGPGYLRTVQAACSVASALRVPCSDSGMSHTTGVLMTYQSYLDSGQTARARSYAERVSETQSHLARLLDTRYASAIRAKAYAGFAVVDGLAGAGVSYVNFHWYGSDPAAMAETMAMYRSRTGLGVITNEIGQKNVDPVLTARLLETLEQEGARFVVWMSQDQDLPEPNKDIFALHEPTGELRSTGQAFRSFLSAR